MSGKLQRLKQNEFLRQNAVFFWAWVGITIINFMYLPVMGRMLSPGDFGEVQAAYSIFNQVSVLVWVMTTLAMANVAQSRGRGREKLVAELQKLSYWIAGGFLLLALAVAPAVAGSLRLHGSWLLVLVALVRLVGVGPAFAQARFQGKREFRNLARAQIILALGRLVFSALLVWANMRAAGAVAGLGLTFIMIEAMAGRWRLPRRPNQWRELVPDWRILKPQARFGFILMACLVAIQVLMNLDMIFVKAYFAPDVAGQYAGVSAAAQLILMLTAPFPMVLAPAISMESGSRRKRILFLRSSALMCMIGGGLLLVYTAFPEAVVRILAGPQYYGMAHLLPIAGLTALMLSVVNLAIHYFMILRRYFVVAASWVGLYLIVAMVNYGHGSVEEVVVRMAVGVFGLLCVVAVSFGAAKLRQVHVKRDPWQWLPWHAR